MIFVECTIFNIETRTPTSKFIKQFDMIDDFNKWYAMAKLDVSMVLNIMKYNPMENPLHKSVNDLKLLGMSRENMI